MLTRLVGNAGLPNNHFEHVEQIAADFNTHPAF